MRRLLVPHYGALAGLFGASFLLFANGAAAQQPHILNAADGSSSAAFWYLGGAPSCCSDSAAAGVGMYYTIWKVIVQPQPGCTDATSLRWDTYPASILSINPWAGDWYAYLVAMGPSYTSHQSSVIYNAQVSVTACGTRSPAFPVFVNTPLVYSEAAEGEYCNGFGCNCYAWPSYVQAGRTYGWGGSWDDSATDILGNSIIRIDLHEELATWNWYPGTNWSTYMAPPQSTGWPATLWDSNTDWRDYIGACFPAQDVLNPLIEPWMTYGAGTNLIVTGTQTFRAGTAQVNGEGECLVSRNNMSYYSGYATDNIGQTPCSGN